MHNAHRCRATRWIEMKMSRRVDIFIWKNLPSMRNSTIHYCHFACAFVHCTLVISTEHFFDFSTNYSEGCDFRNVKAKMRRTFSHTFFCFSISQTETKAKAENAQTTTIIITNVWMMFTSLSVAFNFSHAQTHHQMETNFYQIENPLWCCCRRCWRCNFEKKRIYRRLELSCLWRNLSRRLEIVKIREICVIVCFSK